MVEVKELAILFKRRVDQESGDTTFIPYRIIEGCYDEDNEVFIDKDENSYHHIVDFELFAGNAYGGRVEISKLLSENPKATLKELKKELFEESQKYYYARKDGEYLIFVIPKTTMEADIYEDKETAEWYERYEQAIPYEEVFEDPEEQPTTEQTSKEVDYHLMNETPISYVNKIKDTIKGQDKAIEKIITAFWMHYNLKGLTKKNLLVLGPTGVGKTETFRQLAKELGIPITIYSVPGITQSGYVGKSVDSILVKAYYECGKDLNKLEHSIIVLDEIDKLSEKGDSNESVATSGVQQELLTLIEGGKRTVEMDSQGHKTFNVDTTNIIFVGTGAFQGLFEKPKPPVGFENIPKKQEENDLNKILYKYGMMKELLGRMPIIIPFERLTKEVFKDIILNSKKSEVKTILANLENLGITITNFDEILDLIVEDALSRDTGARGIITTTTSIFSKVFYDIANNPDTYNTLTLGKNILKNNRDYILEKRNNLSKIKIKAIRK